jgi:retron-type reverse transcriptase
MADLGFTMKTSNNLYEKTHSLDNLRLAFNKARKGKSKKNYVIEFEANLENELLKLKQELETLTYKPKPLKIFIIRDPKTRRISVSHFRDRVVHHALCNIIEPIFDKTFICDSCANRKKKGTSYAMKRFDKFFRKVTSNGKLLKNSKNNNMVMGYVLKADIKHYFDTVDHKIMIKIIRKKISDEKVIWLIEKILDNHNSKLKGKGMPIGNLTSQFFANVYLNELDYFVKHNLKAKYYIRYVDDFVILHKSKEKLVLWKWLINNFLKSIKLELHPEKSRIIPLHKGIKFLGFRVFYHYKIPKKGNLIKIEKRIKELKEAFQKNLIGKDKLNDVLNGWNSYLLLGNTYRLRKNIKKEFNKIISTS